MELVWTTMIAIGAVGFLCVFLPSAADAYLRYRDPRLVRCPDTGGMETVHLDAWHAAATAVPGPPGMYVIGCSRWPARAGCDRACIEGAAAH